MHTQLHGPLNSDTTILHTSHVAGEWVSEPQLLELIVFQGGLTPLRPVGEAGGQFLLGASGLTPADVMDRLVNPAPPALPLERWTVDRQEALRIGASFVAGQEAYVPVPLPGGRSVLMLNWVLSDLAADMFRLWWDGLEEQALRLPSLRA